MSESYCFSFIIDLRFNTRQYTLKVFLSHSALSFIKSHRRFPKGFDMCLVVSTMADCNCIIASEVWHRPLGCFFVEFCDLRSPIALLHQRFAYESFLKRYYILYYNCFIKSFWILFLSHRSF